MRAPRAGPDHTGPRFSLLPVDVARDAPTCSAAPPRNPGPNPDIQSMGPSTPVRPSVELQRACGLTNRATTSGCAAHAFRSMSATASSTSRALSASSKSRLSAATIAGATRFCESFDTALRRKMEAIDQVMSRRAAKRARLEEFSRSCRERRREHRCPILENLKGGTPLS